MRMMKPCRSTLFCLSKEKKKKKYSSKDFRSSSFKIYFFSTFFLFIVPKFQPFLYFLMKFKQEFGILSLIFISKIYQNGKEFRTLLRSSSVKNVTSSSSLYFFAHQEWPFSIGCWGNKRARTNKNSSLILFSLFSSILTSSSSPNHHHLLFFFRDRQDFFSGDLFVPIIFFRDGCTNFHWI